MSFVQQCSSSWAFPDQELPLDTCRHLLPAHLCQACGSKCASAPLGLSGLAKGSLTCSSHQRLPWADTAACKPPVCPRLVLTLDHEVVPSWRGPRV